MILFLTYFLIPIALDALIVFIIHVIFNLGSILKRLVIATLVFIVIAVIMILFPFIPSIFVAIWAIITEFAYITIPLGIIISILIVRAIVKKIKKVKASKVAATNVEMNNDESDII